MTEFKIVMLGAGGVGKSALTMQFVRGSFIQNYDPTVEDLYTKNVRFNNKNYNLEILDTAGVEQFASMSDLYIRNGHGFILVYSITSAQSFKEIDGLQQKIQNIKQSSNVPMIIAGNKADLEYERKVRHSSHFNAVQQQTYGKQSKVRYYELTAKDNSQTQQMYLELVRLMVEQQMKGEGGACCTVSWNK